MKRVVSRTEGSHMGGYEENPGMPQITITGGAGFIGANVARHYLNHG